MALAHVQHVQLDAFADAFEGHARRIQSLLAGQRQAVDARQQVGGVQSIQRGVQRLHAVVAHVGHDAAQRGRHARVARHDAVGRVHFVHHGAHVQRPAPAEGHVGEFARVVPAFDRHHPDRARHLGVGHGQDGLGRRMHG
ncbi:hypothetical protein D3C78_1438980 [compost metagenome]